MKYLKLLKNKDIFFKKSSLYAKVVLGRFLFNRAKK